MQRIEDKKAAMEMSVGTIVTIVLLVSVLVLGLVLIRSIFTSAKGIVDLTDDQLRKEIGQVFSEEKKLAVYPTSKRLEIPQGDLDGFGIWIQNTYTGSSATKTFSYEVVVSDPDLRRKCEVTESEVLSWITTGRTEEGIPIPPGEVSPQEVLFDIPEGSPLCTIRFRVNVNAEGTAYATDFFNLKIVTS